ncbi:autotransporter domain-containing protein [Billgrantia endophytica]|uniref:autotransporter family protein n=1 Tax=Billgrantia endophytica TaxID=2033802 RepID=UPI001F0C949F|nr:autotransporter domain-containing protein [Halomonas endophytica]
MDVLSLGDGDGRIVFNHTESDHAFTSDIIGEGVIEQYAGTTLLTGDNSGFTGTTIISGGNLVVGLDGQGRLGGISRVASGGRLGGSGTVGTTVLADGAILEPGNSIGELTVDGDLTFEAGSIYEVEVDPGGTASDHVHVTGIATLAGTVAHIGEAGDYAPESTYRILSAEGGLDGEFDDVRSDFIFLDAGLEYDTESPLHGVDLTLVRNDTALDDERFAGTRNQRATAGGIDSLAAGHAVYDAIVTHTNEDELRDAYDRLSGELHASAHGALIEDSRLVRGAVNDRLRGAMGSIAAPMDSEAQGTGSTSPNASVPTGWVRAIGNWGRSDGDGNAASLDRDTHGVLVGVDAPVSERTQVGLLTGYTRSDLSAGGGRGSADVDSIHLGLYAGTTLGDGDLALRGGAFYGYHEIDSQRHVQVGTLNERLEDERRAHTLHAYAELARAFGAGALTLEPFANLAHVHHRASHGAEEGGDAALYSGSETFDTTFTTLGFRPTVQFGVGEASATLYGSVGWRHAFGDTTPERDQRFAGGDAFSVAGTPIAENTGVVEAGVSVSLNERTSLDLAYGGQYGDGMEDHGGRATFAWRF